MAVVQKPSPYDIYSFFRAVRSSFRTDADYSDLMSTLFIPHDVMPLSEILDNVLPYFRRSQNPALFTTFQVIIRAAEEDSAFDATFMRVCDALDVLIKIDRALGGDRWLVEGYLDALQLDNASASHQQVMNSITRFLDERCDPVTSLRVRKVFATVGAAEELGLTDEILDMVSDIIKDDNLYIQIVQCLQLNHRQNLTWDAVMNRIERIVQSTKPAVWPELRAFFEALHQGYTPPQYTEQDNIDGYDGGESEYAAYDQYTDPSAAPDDEQSNAHITQSMANVRIGESGVSSRTSSTPCEDAVGRA